MGLRTSPQGPEETKTLLEISSPTQEDFENLTLDQLHELWAANHQKLKKALQHYNPRYFGLHGTNQEAFQQIEANPQGRVEIATFYEKEYADEQFPYKLYQAALYVLNYASKGDLGRIMIFDLEEKEENITHPWERLISIGYHLGLTCDSPEEQEHFAALNTQLPEDLGHCDSLFRSDIELDSLTFDQRFMASIDMSDPHFAKYFPPLDDYGRAYMRIRFLAQEIIAQALQSII